MLEGDNQTCIVCPASCKVTKQAGGGRSNRDSAAGLSPKRYLHLSVPVSATRRLVHHPKVCSQEYADIFVGYFFGCRCGKKGYTV